MADDELEADFSASDASEASDTEAAPVPALPQTPAPHISPPPLASPPAAAPKPCAPDAAAKACEEPPRRKAMPPAKAMPKAFLAKAKAAAAASSLPTAPAHASQPSEKAEVARDVTKMTTQELLDTMEMHLKASAPLAVSDAASSNASAPAEPVETSMLSPESDAERLAEEDGFEEKDCREGPGRPPATPLTLRRDGYSIGVSLSSDEEQIDEMDVQPLAGEESSVRLSGGEDIAAPARSAPAAPEEPSGAAAEDSVVSEAAPPKPKAMPGRKKYRYDGRPLGDILAEEFCQDFQRLDVPAADAACTLGAEKDSRPIGSLLKKARLGQPLQLQKPLGSQLAEAFKSDFDSLDHTADEACPAPVAQADDVVVLVDSDDEGTSAPAACDGKDEEWSQGPAEPGVPPPGWQTLPLRPRWPRPKHRGGWRPS